MNCVSKFLRRELGAKPGQWRWAQLVRSPFTPGLGSRPRRGDTRLALKARPVPLFPASARLSAAKNLPASAVSGREHREGALFTGEFAGRPPKALQGRPEPARSRIFPPFSAISGGFFAAQIRILIGGGRADRNRSAPPPPLPSRRPPARFRQRSSTNPTR